MSGADDPPDNAGRDQAGRFAAGTSGNLAGKPRGLLHAALLALDAIGTKGGTSSIISSIRSAGCRFMKSESREMTSRTAKVVAKSIRSIPRISLVPRATCSASSSSARTDSMRARKCKPASVFPLGGAMAQVAESGYSLPLALAMKAATKAIATCASNGYPVSAVVVDPSGVIKLEAKGDHSTILTATSAFRKAYTVVTFGPIFRFDASSTFTAAAPSAPPSPRVLPTEARCRWLIAGRFNYEGPVDGIFGPLTRAAIRHFQQQNIGADATGHLTADQANRLVTPP
jgi:uncharacterized protein GlcG (DUF336 family)